MSRSKSEPSRRFRPAITIGMLALVAAMASDLGSPVAAAQDRTAAWLESRGLDELLAQHLEASLEAARGDQAARERIAGRLARTYSRLLRAEPDEDRRAAIVQRSERMIDIVPDEDAGELRVALVRNRYVRASQILEDDRIGVGEPEKIQEALAELAEIARDLGSIRDRADADARQAARGRGRLVQDRIERQLELAANAGLIEGWSRYYIGRARRDRSELERAQTAIGSVLQGDSPIPSVDEVSIDMQAADGFANAILANAMITSLLDSPDVAKKWFDRLDMERTHESVRRAAPGWRLASLIDADAFREANLLFESQIAQARAQGDQALPLPWIRLAAVGGLRGAKGQVGGEALLLAEAALAELAGRGELDEVRALAADFGLDALGDRGFVFGYVRGIDRHRTAIEARDAGDASGAASAFRESVELLRRALAESDAQRFPEQVGAASMLIGWNLLELDEAAAAADAFAEAADRMSGDRRADAFWGAIVALDRIVAAGGDEAADAAARRDALAERFLDAFPADDRSPALVVRRIAEQVSPDSDDLDVLLGVPSTNSSWETARRRAVQALYRAFREAPDEQRAETGHRMLTVADELLQRERDGDGIFTDVRGLDGMLLRQAAEVASDERVHDTARAERYLEQLESALQRGALTEAPDLPNEIQYRRLGIALGDGDFEYAGRLLEQMPVAPETPEADRWARLGALRIHQSADVLIRSGPVPIDVARACADAGARYLELVGESSADDEADTPEVEDGTPRDRFAVLDRDRMLPIAARVASAQAAVFSAGGDPQDGAEALAWYRAVLERRPLEGGILEAVGRLGEAMGESEVALDAWRRLVRAAPDGTELWWTAKVGQIRTLVSTDPAGARAVFDQLQALHPELGPDPWNRDLRDLDVRIDVALGSGGES
jgi:hypothetical protein